jgi:hypothetical protein
MALGKVLVFLSVVATALSLGSAQPRAADDQVDCNGTPNTAVRVLPAPLRKWGHINCTQFGHMLESRDGWVWAWLDGSGEVAIPSQMVKRDPVELGNDSYFVTIEIAELEPEKLLFAVSLFNDGLNITEEGEVKGYRATLTSVSGRSTTIYFLDFATFAGGIWCPDDGCVAQSRFMIMEKDHAAELRAASV